MREKCVTSYPCVLLCIQSSDLIPEWIYFLQVAVTDVKETARDADVLIFVVPHQFVDRLCSQMKDVIKPDAVAMSLIKVRYVHVFLVMSEFCGLRDRIEKSGQ